MPSGQDGRPLAGAIAAAVTPLSQDASGVDLAAIHGLVEFYRASGLDGVLALGTTGEGILLGPDERRQVATEFVAAASPTMPVAVHCGAQTTADTVQLCRHAAEIGAAAVAVIAPPYFALDEAELEAHFSAALRACDPVPFYLYEFAARSGYAVPPAVIERLRHQHRNLVGLKVSDSPWESFERYFLDGLDIFTGPEALMSDAFQRGAVGVVSGLGGGLPIEVVAAVRERTAAAAARVGALRREVSRFPFQSALKRLLQRQGVRLELSARPPLASLSADQVREIDDLADRILADRRPG